MTKTNEVANQNVNQETGEIIQAPQQNIVRETDQFIVVKDDEGKYSRKAKYNDYSSVKAETKEDKIWLMNLLEADEDSGFGLKENVGETIEVQDVILRSYDRINEDNGNQEFGVLTYLITPEKDAYVTSSKTVYFSITRMMDMFGKPDSEDWENIKVKVGTQKGQNGNIIKIKIVG